MSETLPLMFFSLFSADQIPDCAAVADPNRSHAGRINSPVQNLWEDGVTLAPVCYSSPAPAPKAVSQQHQTAAEKHPRINITFLILTFSTEL